MVDSLASPKAAKALATLLRGDFVARVHVPSRDVRQRKQRLRGKGANDAITIVARRMAIIAWKMLAQERDYTPQAPAATPAKSISPAALTKLESAGFVNGG